VNEVLRLVKEHGADAVPYVDKLLSYYQVPALERQILESLLLTLIRQLPTPAAA
jgi:hypothetical protein